jgi:hypothetical protein
VALVLISLFTGWTFRYEEGYQEYGRAGKMHRNRITGVVCLLTDECWFESDLASK